MTCIAGLVPELVDRLGQNICIQAGGGIHGHPDGTHAGSKALRQAVDAAVVGEELDTYAEAHPELATAIQEWGTETPR